MIFPIGDTPNPRNYFPWVNWLLITLNVIVFVTVSLPLSWTVPAASDPVLQEYLYEVSRAVPGMTPELLATQTSAYDLFLWEWGFKSGAPELVDLFSAMFLHASFTHLGGNMLFLWIYGDNVEHRLGHLGYAIAYIGTGICATALYAVLAGSSILPMVGASGAISGVLGLYFVMFPKNKVKLWVFLFPFIMNVILVNARWVLGFYLVIENLFPALFGSTAGGGVAYGAHIGGFLGGMALAWAGDRLLWGRSARQAGGTPRDTSPEEMARQHFERARFLLANGQRVAAYQHLERVIELDAVPELTEAARRALQQVHVFEPRRRR